MICLGLPSTPLLRSSWYHPHIHSDDPSEFAKKKKSHAEHINRYVLPVRRCPFRPRTAGYSGLCEQVHCCGDAAANFPAATLVHWAKQTPLGFSVIIILIITDCGDGPYLGVPLPISWLPYAVLLQNMWTKLRRRILARNRTPLISTVWPCSFFFFFFSAIDLRWIMRYRPETETKVHSTSSMYKPNVGFVGVAESEMCLSRCLQKG